MMVAPKLRFKADDGSDFSGWEEKTLGELCAPLTYGMNAAATKFDGENRYIRITDIDDETHALLPNDIVSPSGELDDKYLVKKGDILLARTGASTGKSFLYHPKDGKLFYAGFLIKAHVLPSSDDYFIYSQTLTDRYWKWVKTASMRSGQPGINANEYASYSFAVPSLPEQRKIADFLSAVDAVIAAQQAEVDAWEQRKKGVMQKLFSQEVRFKADDGSDFPDWEEKTLGEITGLFVGKSFTSELNKNGRYVVMDMGSVSSDGSIIDAKLTDLDRDILRRGDLIMPKDDIGGGLIIGKTAYIPCDDKYVCGDHVYRLRFDSEIDGLFMHYEINSSGPQRRLGRKVTGSAQLGLNSKSVSSETVSVPSLPEQRKIADCLSSMDEVIQKSKDELAKWQELKKGLLQQMFV
ncbi:restriction endonuclease subunit S [Bifidobacterium pseudocatenulatum]|uniref:Restriction endonuclease subunit S n=1 Tax=Bifidobacterium pseudocatenulatum TaxID=28026 RepID=A0A267WKM3_BIFPS|nr:restriction endonuclease subunit S [Bifidobacterium pseudocatenulatum]PAC73176.1 restriction endonuclease subunit S [Bifidobacterium pseudocatenulatum]